MTQALPKNPVAMISGGLGDIGWATALELTKAGCRVSIGDVEPSTDLDEGIHYQQVDVSDEVSVKQWFASVEKHFGEPASVIVANAGIVLLGSAMSASLADWQRTLDVNLTGAWLTARTGAQRLLDANMSGRIVFVGSWAAHAPHVKMAAYSAAKAGLRMLSQTMALELADKGILVNEIAPGFVNAGLSGKFFKENPDKAEESRSMVPNKQLIEVEEVAASIAYLCSPAHRNMTGSTLLLDGGLSARRRMD
jgi:glucose 1-dehydrogenase